MTFCVAKGKEKLFDAERLRIAQKNPRTGLEFQNILFVCTENSHKLCLYIYIYICVCVCVCVKQTYVRARIGILSQIINILNTNPLIIFR